MDPDHLVSDSESPELGTEKSLARTRLNRALELLPLEQRDVFLLHEESGLSIEHIAYVTDVNRETAKSRLRYAVKKLRTALSDPAEDMA
jgi:RNA polymerase sigma-70 factor (ECF subfamily)